MLFTQVHALHNNPILIRENPDNFTDGAFIITADHHHAITFSYLFLHRNTPLQLAK
jgi:hypothetical protein